MLILIHTVFNQILNANCQVVEFTAIPLTKQACGDNGKKQLPFTRKQNKNPVGRPSVTDWGLERTETHMH